MQIEALRQAQLALEESRDEYANLFDFAPVGYLTLDDIGLISRINLTAASLLGNERTNLLNRRFDLFVDEADRQRWQSHFANALKQDGATPIEVMLTQGASLFVAVRIDCLRHGDVTESSTLRIALIDISTRRHAEEALRLSVARECARQEELELVRQQLFHKDKMATISALAAAVAHEINNPLTAIVGLAQAMLDEDVAPDSSKQGTSRPQLIMNQAQRVIRITRQISEFSVPQSQEPELTDINGLVRSTCHFVSYDRRFQRIEIRQELDRTLPAAHVIADHVVQILMNLLINAADALENCSGECPTINVRTERRNGGLRIAISDNGCGITAENLGKVLTKHFTTKAPGRGSGLGLGLCRSLIESAGGAISIESHGNQGTTVAIILPNQEKGLAP